MTYAVSLGAIGTRALQRANLEGAVSGTPNAAFLSTDELYGAVNQSLTEWYDLVRLTTWGGQFYRSAYALPSGTLPNQSSYALPSDFLSMLSVDCFVAGGQSLVVSAKPYQEEARNVFRWYPTGWLFSQPVYYQLQGANINFIPTPQGTFNVTLNYVPTSPQFVATPSYDPAATLDFINGWEEWIVLDVAIKLLVKDGQTDIIPFLQGLLAKQTDRIVKAAASRDTGAAECVHDVTSDFDSAGRDP